MRLSTDKLVQWSTAAAVVLLAVVAGWVSYIHAHDVVIRYGQRGALGYAYPVTTDGLIYVASMVILDAARRRIKAPKLAWGTLITGIVVTGAANVYDGLQHGVIGSIISGWPALALVLGYELCMMLIRSAGKGKPELTAPHGWTPGDVERFKATWTDAQPHSLEPEPVESAPPAAAEPDQAGGAQPRPAPIEVIPPDTERIPVRFGGLGDLVGGAASNGAAKS